ncbi:NAD(P)H-quinone oxidoreductase [Paenibacillus sp. GCM10027627]|uniref:NAD(P)H-quinone oxidoreductase n=1 Tax=unclassified Paenibacillus TaxID=185978 RepID=UPI003637D5C9
MKAILQQSQSKTLYIGETEEPSSAFGDLVVRVKATALNRADLLQKRGLYPPPPGASPLLGLEMAGIVEEGSGPWKPGDRVMALLPGGGYAERVRLPAGMAMAIPEGLSFAEAAAIPEVFLTAYLNLFCLGGLEAGHRVLIHAGASGVGTAAIQLAKDAGCFVVATAGTEKKRAACLQLGADLVLDYRKGPFLPEVLDATCGQGVQLVFDVIGAAYWEQNIAALAVDGKLIVAGLLGGGKAEGLHLGHLLSKRLQIIGTALRNLPQERKEKLTASFAAEQLPKFMSGKLHPVIDSIWHWSEGEGAHRKMEENLNIGKIVLTLD